MSLDWALKTCAYMNNKISLPIKILRKSKRAMITFIQTAVTTCACVIVSGFFNLFYRYRYFSSLFMLRMNNEESLDGCFHWRASIKWKYRWGFAVHSHFSVISTIILWIFGRYSVGTSDFSKGKQLVYKIQHITHISRSLYSSWTW